MTSFVQPEVLRAIARHMPSLEDFYFPATFFDRQIIGASYLKASNLPEADDMLGLLQRATDGPQTLEVLFKSLQRDFNGSLFGPLLDDYQIQQTEVEHLQRFLSGEDLTNGSACALQTLSLRLCACRTNQFYL